MIQGGGKFGPPSSPISSLALIKPHSPSLALQNPPHTGFTHGLPGFIIMANNILDVNPQTLRNAMAWAESPFMVLHS